MQSKHPIFAGGTFGLISGDNPHYHSEYGNHGHEALGNAMRQMGLNFEEVAGRYGTPERSYIVHNPTQDQMKELGEQFGQESVIHSQNGIHRLIYTNGENVGKWHPANTQNPVEHFEKPPSDFYTHLPGHGYFRINFDFDKLNDDGLSKSLTTTFNQHPAPHPHSYEWHDGHTQHYAQDDLAKGEADMPDDGPSQFRRYSIPHGEVRAGSKPDLNFYNYSGKLPEAVKLASDFGYKHYLVGGPHGKPDLANRNYNTGHLMVFEPSMNNRRAEHARNDAYAYVVTHELAHALTLPEVNKIYGEAPRIGKLGTHRTLNDALRAVHWEHMAVQKQRELNKSLGINISDEDFNRERNTVMGEAITRAITGRFTTPNDEGFVPHARSVPLHTSLQVVRDAAREMGLTGLHDKLPKRPNQLVKSLPNLQAPPAAIKPQMHSDVQGFMTGLKALQGPERGKFITAHMNHGPFLAALQSHPQGKQIHSMLTGFLNSKVNAGVKPGATVVVAKATAEDGFEKLEKRSKNVREQTRQINSSAASARIRAYLNRHRKDLGIVAEEPHYKRSDAQISVGPTGAAHVNHNWEIPQFHEAGHVLAAPEGANMDEWQALIGEPSYATTATEVADERAANRIGFGIARRAGVSPGVFDFSGANTVHGQNKRPTMVRDPNNRLAGVPVGDKLAQERLQALDEKRIGVVGGRLQISPERSPILKRKK